jgi:hypothetical protein
MATEYRLTLAGETLPVEVAERALPDPDEGPVGTPDLLSADLYDLFRDWPGPVSPRSPA